MNGILRRLRGAIGVGVTWAVLWVLLGSLVLGAFMLIDPADIGPGEGASQVLPIFALVGFLSGTGFAALLAFSERAKKLTELSLWRVGLLGALGSVAIPWLLGADKGEGWLTGTFGAAFAAGSVAIARRGARDS